MDPVHWKRVTQSGLVEIKMYNANETNQNNHKQNQVDNQNFSTDIQFYQCFPKGN